MNKNRFFLLLLSVIMIACVFTGCSSKTPITTEAFTQKMTAAGFVVEDVTEGTETNGLATAILVAINEKDGYQIELWELVDDATGAGVYKNNKNRLSNEHSIKTVSVSLSGGNYGYTAFTADGNFHVVTRIANTMIYCEADKDHKDAIVDILKELGYK